MSRTYKLGCLTWWKGNYGSILQAYALQRKLAIYPNLDYELLRKDTVKAATLSNLFFHLYYQGLWETSKMIMGRFALPGLRRREKRTMHFIETHLRLSTKVYTEQDTDALNKDYDGFLVGSDQLWNSSASNALSYYLLDFAEKEKAKLSYAPSIGNPKMTSELTALYRKYLSDFDAISCREEVGTRLINQLLRDTVCHTVLDPVMLVQTEVWDNLCKETRKSTSLKDEYIFVYLLRGTIENRKAIERFSRETGLPIVTIPILDSTHWTVYDFKFGDMRVWDCNPVDFISYIRNARFVFTDSFHCTVFSILYHKPFYLFPKIGENQSARLVDLLERMGISSRYLKENTVDLDQFEPIDWRNVDERIAKERQSSSNYLDQAIARMEAKVNGEE